VSDAGVRAVGDSFVLGHERQAKINLRGLQTLREGCMRRMNLIRPEMQTNPLGTAVYIANKHPGKTSGQGRIRTVKTLTPHQVSREVRVEHHAIVQVFYWPKMRILLHMVK